MQRKYDAVIFDLYGTLIDGPYGQESARVEMAKVLGVQPAEFEESWRRFRLQRDAGQLSTVETEIEAAMGGLGAEAKPHAIEAAKAIRYQSIRESLEPRPEAIELLKSLRTRGYKLGLLSNCSSEVPELWSETAFGTLFDATVFSASEQLVKPDKAIFTRAVDRLEVAPERCLYIGDGDSNELDAAAAIGMTPWLLLLSYEDPPRSAKHAESVERWRHRHLRSLAEVMDVVEGRLP